MLENSFQCRGAKGRPSFACNRQALTGCLRTGGATYLESRVAHEVAATSEWVVIVGGTHILTPRQFIKDFEEFASESTGKTVKDFFSERLKY